MRVTFNSSFSRMSTDLARATAELAARQREVSSGRRLSTASDDPSAAAGSVRERSVLAALGQYRQAADSAMSRLTVVDSVLADSIERLTTAQTTILGARGSAVTPAQREAAANELIGIRDALYSNLNTTFRGTYLFGGSSGTTAPFRKLPDGTVAANAIDDTPVFVDVGQELTVQATYSATAIAQGTAAEDLFASIERAIAAVRAGDDPAMGAAAAAIRQTFERATAAQSHAGTSIQALETQQGRIGELRLAGEARVAGYEQANLAEAISRMNQADTAYRAALGAIGAAGQTTLMDYLR